MKDDVSWSRRGLMGATAALGLTALTRGGVKAAAPRARPNVLFIVADDLGYADLSCYGCTDYRTPHVDSLATAGIRLVEGYANSSVCSATRTALLTGRYQYRFRAGLEEPLTADEVSLPPSTVTMPGLFRELGYRTSLIGKWHLGGPVETGPLKNGYDSFFGIYGGGTDYFLYGGMGPGYRLVENGRPVEGHAYLTDVLGARAVAEVQGFAAVNTPFFMSLHFTAPHFPWEGPKDRVHAGQIADLWDREGGSVAVYAQMVQSMDENIGRVLQALEDHGLADDTIVIFTSDNGGERFSNTWPFIGVKTELLEGGIRVPIIVRWPGRIAKGAVSQQVMISMDFMPTLLAAAGMTKLDRLGLDGENLLPILQGKTPPVARKLFWRYKARDQAAVRDGRWKYLKMDGKEHLFDIEADARERADLGKRHPDRLAELRAAFAAWNATMLPYPANSYSHDMKGDLLFD